ncbi:MAG: tetrahydrofolate synthase [Prevotella salivae]|nr:tetrahydrofolate synthase [Segatella salivae]
MQRCKRCSNIPMNTTIMVNVVTIQYRGCYAGIPMHVFRNRNALIAQRRRCCTFDSPGLARNEPTLGKRSQGDSTL